FSFEISQFNRATQAKRQPGSAIKPFVYLTALEHGYTPSTLVEDGPISLPQGPGMPMWSPVNYEHNFMGTIPLRVALEHSRNVEWKKQPVPTIPDSSEQIVDPVADYQLVQMMQGVVQRGTGASVRAVGKPIAGKTGTTSDWQDAWFLGFTPDLAAGVFIGYDE